MFPSGHPTSGRGSISFLADFRAQCPVDRRSPAGRRRRDQSAQHSHSDSMKIPPNPPGNDRLRRVTWSPRRPGTSDHPHRFHPRKEGKRAQEVRSRYGRQPAGQPTDQHRPTAGIEPRSTEDNENAEFGQRQRRDIQKLSVVRVRNSRERNAVSRRATRRGSWSSRGSTCRRGRHGAHPP